MNDFPCILAFVGDERLGEPDQFPCDPGVLVHFVFSPVLEMSSSGKRNAFPDNVPGLVMDRFLIIDRNPFVYKRKREWPGYFFLNISYVTTM